MCRRWVGGPGMAIEVGKDLAIEGREHVATYRSSDWAERAFCKTCGSSLCYRLVEAGDHHLFAGLLDDQADLVLTSQIFIDEKPAYYTFANQTKTKTGAEVFAAFPDLAFVGRASTVSNMLTYSLQARWLGALLEGHHRLPDDDAMRREIAAMKAWKQSWMPPSTARSARLIIHMQHYHDELLTDLGASPLRKRGALAPLKELICPYEPADYATIVTGAWKRHEAPIVRPQAPG